MNINVQKKYDSCKDENFFESKTVRMKKLTMIIITITYQIYRCLSEFKSKSDYKSFLCVSVKISSEG